jgi:hypothetical protein
MQVLYDNDRLSISYNEGRQSSGQAVVSFSGIGLGLGGLPREEFAKTLSDQETDSFFVVDKIRSWYNVTATEIQEVLADRTSRYSACLTLGNSMGGFGAIYFASRMPNCKAAVAFGPQYSICPQVAPRERRWSQFRNQIREWTVPHALVDASPGPKLYAFFGGLSDRYQARLYLQNAAPNLNVVIIPKCKHNTAGFLRGEGCLTPILDAAWKQAGIEEMLEILARGGVAAQRNLPDRQRSDMADAL